MINIQMIGIDHSRASVEERELFSFTKTKQKELMEAVVRQQSVDGCVLLSTCNRMELYVSLDAKAEPDLYRIICHCKQISGEEEKRLRELFTVRTEEDAVRHLFLLTAGLKSKIIGEDQILTQVGDALEFARSGEFADTVLKTLFRMAVTAGKKIKTQVAIPKGNTSTIDAALTQLARQGYQFAGENCLVIGNGEMGKVAAQTLRDAGANVTVTVRKYRSGMVSIPIGCSRIHYGERMNFLPNCDIVVSATASPNFTLREELFRDITIRKPLLLLDLAVPRDIEPSLGRKENITLYDMDSFHTEKLSPEANESLVRAAAIVEEQMAEFFQWLDGRDVIPRIQEIKAEAVQDLNLRIEKILKKTPMQEEDRVQLLEAVDTAAGKVVNKMIFGLRDSLNQEAFLECVAGLEKVYEE